jgi:outer membrane lipoprotein carrier protein
MLCWLALAAFAPSSSSSPPSSDVQAIVHAVQSRYDHTHTLFASFLERYTQGGRLAQVESGSVYFSRPGRMRWDYESPETKLFLVDGKNVWFYIPADRTASRARVRDSADWRTPFALLTGKLSLSRLCGRIELVGNGSDSTAPAAGAAVQTLRCTSRAAEAGEDSAPFKEVLLGLDAQYRIVSVLIREAGDTETEFEFGNWEENPELPESKFHFEPPTGVAIVDQSDLVGSIH